MLIVALDTSKKEPLYEQIYNSIKEDFLELYNEKNVYCIPVNCIL